MTENLLTLNDTINKYISKVNKLDCRIRMLLKNESITIQKESNTNDLTNIDTKLPDITPKKNFFEEGLTKNDIT